MKDNNILMMADTAKATFPWGAELNIPLNGIPENLNEIVNHAIQEEKEQYYKKWEKIVRIHNQQWCGEQTVEPYLHIYIPGGKDPHGKFDYSLCVFFTDLKDKTLFSTARIDIDLDKTDGLRSVISDAVSGIIK